MSMKISNFFNKIGYLGIDLGKKTTFFREDEEFVNRNYLFLRAEKPLFFFLNNCDFSN